MVPFSADIGSIGSFSCPRVRFQFDCAQFNGLARNSLASQFNGLVRDSLCAGGMGGRSRRRCPFWPLGQKGVVKPPAEPPHRKPALREARVSVRSERAIQRVRFQFDCAQFNGLARNSLASQFNGLARDSLCAGGMGRRSRRRSLLG